MISHEYANVEQVLELVTAEMAAIKKPKVLLFDVGGVCVSELAQFPWIAVTQYLSSCLYKRLPGGKCSRLECND